MMAESPRMAGGSVPGTPLPGGRGSGPRRARRFLLLALALAPAACAEPGCGNPYVLDFVNAADAKSDVLHLGLVRDGVRTDPDPVPGVVQCSIWERARNPAPGAAPGQPPVLLRPQHYTVTKVDDGWRVGGLGS